MPALLNSLRNRVLRYFPDISITSSRVSFNGWDSYVLIINEKYAFKFPRSEEYEESLGKEINLLKYLKDCPVSVPNYRYLIRNQDDFFGGYDLIQGEPLNSLSTLSGTASEQLSDFLNYLLEKGKSAVKDGVIDYRDENEWRDRYRSLYRTISDKYSSFLSDETVSILNGLFREFLGTTSSRIETSLIHGDLYRNNVLVDQRKGKLNGIIDWGESAIGDPAIDFAALAVDFPVNEINEIIRKYRGTVDGMFIRRMEFYWKVEPVYALMSSVRKGNDEEAGRNAETFSKRLVASLF